MKLWAARIIKILQQLRQLIAVLQRQTNRQVQAAAAVELRDGSQIRDYPRDMPKAGLQLSMNWNGEQECANDDGKDRG